MDSALYLTPESPYPVAGGGALRAASLLQYLSRRYRVDAIVFRQPEEIIEIPPGLLDRLHILDLPAHARHLPARLLRNAVRMARRVPPLVDRFAGFGPRIASVLTGRTYELAVIEHFWCAPYWQQVSAVSRRTVLDLHNIESVLHSRCGAVEQFPAAVAHRWFRAPCARLERHWWPKFSTLLVPSQADAALALAICAGARPLVYPNTIPRVELPQRAERHMVAFSGNLEYHPNRMAVRFFRRDIWPGLRRRWPELVWRLIGRNEHAVRNHTDGDARIETSGPVADAIAELAAAQVVVAPLLAGSGTRLKIMEAWAAGRAVVSTTVGAEGLEARDGEHLLLADDASAFAAAVSRLLESEPLRRALGAAGRRLYESHYTWDAAWSGLEL